MGRGPRSTRLWSLLVLLVVVGVGGVDSEAARRHGHRAGVHAHKARRAHAHAHAHARAGAHLHARSHKKVDSMAEGGSGMQTATGEGLGGDEAFSLKLHKSSVSEMERAQFLMMLKAVRATLITVKGDHGPALLELGNEPLQMQVLSEKRLATYFGKIQIGQCVNAAKTASQECSEEEKKSMTFKALFDTGSCEFWMPNKDCEHNTVPATRCGKHTLYTPSPTYKNRIDGAGPFSSDQKMCIQYLSGKVEGFMAKDTIRVGSFDVTGQVFGMADTIDVPLLDEVVWDGIVGLAYPNDKLQKQGVVPLFDNMMTKLKLPNNVFSYYIGSASGAVTFGGVDSDYFTANDSTFRYAVVTEKSYWSIDIVDVLLQFGTLPAESTGVCTEKYKDENDPGAGKVNENNRCKAIVDTGTYLIYGPRESVTTKLDRIALPDGCNSIGQLPKVTFVFYAGENSTPAKLTLQPHDYTLEFVVPKQGGSSSGSEQSGFLEEGMGQGEGQGLRSTASTAAAAALHTEAQRLGAGVEAKAFAKMMQHQRTARRLRRMSKAETRDNSCNKPENRKNTDKCQQDCVIGIGPDNDPGWTLGQVFLRSFYTVFDRDTDRVGFVRSNPQGDMDKYTKSSNTKKHAPPNILYGSLASSDGVEQVDRTVPSVQPAL